MKTKHNHFNEHNPRWKGGKSEGYILRLVQTAVKESGRRIDRCENCGLVGNPFKINIHHLDQDRQNNVASNLKVLCASCHRKTHYNSAFYEVKCDYCTKIKKVTKRVLDKSKKHFCNEKCYYAKLKENDFREPTEYKTNCLSCGTNCVAKRTPRLYCQNCMSLRINQKNREKYRRNKLREK